MPSILFLPGLLCDAALFQPQREALEDAWEIQVADLTQADSIAGMAATALAAAPPRFALAALSMGGYVALEIMRQAPERVTHLALMDTSARQDTAEQRARRLGLLELSRMGQFRGVTPRLLPQLVHPSRLGDSDLCQVVLDMAARVGAEGFLRQQTAILGRVDSRPRLSAIACPTLVLCGAQDVLTPPEHSRELAADIATAELALIPDCGHLASLEQPEAVTGHFRRLLARDGSAA